MSQGKTVPNSPAKREGSKSTLATAQEKPVASARPESITRKQTEVKTKPKSKNGGDDEYMDDVEKRYGGKLNKSGDGTVNIASVKGSQEVTKR